MTNENIIETKGLNFAFKKGIPTLKDVNMSVPTGSIYGFLGPNGAGKTTTFYMVVGLIKPDEGQVFLGDENITGLAMYKRAQMGIGYLPQEASVFRDLTVEENILAVLEMTDLPKQAQRDKVRKNTHLRLEFFVSSSGGQVC